MTDLIIVLVLLALVGGAVRYLYRAKKRGQRCVGCPDGGSCGGNCCCGGEGKH